MDLDSSAFLVASFFIFMGLAITVAPFIRRRASRRVTKLAQASRDIQVDFEEFRNTTNKRIVDLENAVERLKVECAAANIRLGSFKAPKSAATREIAAAAQVDTWTRSENLTDPLPIVPAIEESSDNDTWVRGEGGPNDVEPTNSAALLENVFSEGNAIGSWKSGRAP